jgi:hypothetical protein
MSRPTSLLTALAISSSTLLQLGCLEGAQAMTINWDCFDRSSQALVARSSVDLTSPAISCIQAVGSTPSASTTTAGPGSESALPETSEAPATEPDTSAESNSGAETTSEADVISEDSIGTILGNHLGKLIGQGLADLFR